MSVLRVLHTISFSSFYSYYYYYLFIYLLFLFLVFFSVVLSGCKDAVSRHATARAVVPAARPSGGTYGASNHHVSVPDSSRFSEDENRELIERTKHRLTDGKGTSPLVSFVHVTFDVC